MSDALTTSITELVALATERATTAEHAEQLDRGTAAVSTARCGSRSRARSRPASPRCSTRSSVRSWRPPTRASARRSSPGTSARPTARHRCIRGAEPELRPYRRAGALDIDLGGVLPADVDHLQVGWPTRRLQDVTILDTPGIASISADVSARTLRSSPQTTAACPSPTRSSTCCGIRTRATCVSSSRSTTTK